MAILGDSIESEIESQTEKDQESHNEAPTEEIRIIYCTCSSILNDESFMIPGEGSEMCVRMS